jgi:hypothetical protein
VKRPPGSGGEPEIRRFFADNYIHLHVLKYLGLTSLTSVTARQIRRSMHGRNRFIEQVQNFGIHVHIKFSGE